MSILIKGMEMPECCMLCRFCMRAQYGEYYHEDEAWQCRATRKRITDSTTLKTTFKDEDCPLVEVSTPHGRLIDVDELLNDIGLEDCDYNRDVNAGEIITLENIDRITTVIEAER